MFVLASFISSVIDFQRRRRLKLVLEAFFNDINKQHMSLLCKRTDEASTSGYNNGMGLRKQVSAHLSDPELNIEKDRDFVLYFNECREIIVVPAQLNSFCSRVGFSSRKTMEGLYSCSLEDFLEIVYAWSVDSLYESSTGPAIEMIQTYMIEDALSRTMSSSSCIATTSSRDNSIFALYSFSKQKALPMLEQLFWGDQLGLTQSIRQKFFSESALNIELPFFRQQSFRLPTQPKMKCSTARSSLRYRAPSPSPMAIEFRKNEVSSTDFRRANNGSPANFGSLPSSYRNHSVPPYLRLILEKEQAKKEIQNKQQSSEEKDTKVPEVVPQRACPLVEFSSDVQKVKNSTSTKEIGSSVETFDDLAQYDENRIKIRLLDENVPYIDSQTTSGNSAEDTPRSEVLTTPTNTPRAELSATFEFDPERQMVVANSSRESRKVERTNGRPHANFEVTKSSLNPLRRSIVEVRKDGDFSDNSSSEIQQKFENGLNEFRRQSLVTRRGKVRKKKTRLQREPLLEDYEAAK
ncbi:unnamed protein product, partial [Mesorhabditis belari]|uniref:Uncharacterized protein n=1 Tax=Mesorhabditis belari TaxID=2138241 RepID=A0AAF3FHE5_9BILA